MKKVKDLIEEPDAILAEIYSLGYDEMVDDFMHNRDFIELRNHDNGEVCYLYKREFGEMLASLPIKRFHKFGWSGDYIDRISGQENAKHIVRFHEYLKEQKHIQGAHSKLIYENGCERGWVTLYPGDSAFQFIQGGRMPLS